MSADIYELLLSRARDASPVKRVVMGLSWTVAEADGVGACFSPSEVPRTVPWAGTLRGRESAELQAWIRSFDAAEACVGASLVNASINRSDNPLLARARRLDPGAAPHLAVFAHFAPQLRGASVAVVGRYPGLEQLWREVSYVCLERRPAPDVLPDTAAEAVLPKMDWVFLTGSAIANKTLPRLLALSRGAKVVLMGPSVPWLAEWASFGVSYLAGVGVDDAEALFCTAAEAGGTRIFQTGVAYRLLNL